MAEERQRRLDRLLALRATGMSCAAIADQEARETGKAPRTSAAVQRDIEQALSSRTEHVAEPQRDQLVVLELERLDAMQRSAEATLRSAQTGRCQSCGRSPEPELALKALGVLNRIGASRRALLGLDNRRREVAQEDDPLTRYRRNVGARPQLRAVE